MMHSLLTMARLAADERRRAATRPAEPIHGRVVRLPDPRPTRSGLRS